MNTNSLLIATAALASLVDCPEPKTYDGIGSYSGFAEPVDGRAALCGRNDPCPCGSGKKHKRCCKHLHKAEWPTPEKETSKAIDVLNREEG